MTHRRRKRAKPVPRAAPRVSLGARLRLLWPAWLTALLVAAPLLPSEAAASEGTGVVLIMLQLVLLLAWAVAGMMAGRLELRFGPTTIALALFLLLHTVAALVMASSGSPRAALNMAWQWLSFGAAFLMARQVFTSSVQQRAVTAVMVALAVGLSAHGYHQYFYSMPRTLRDYYENPEAALAKAGIVAPPGSAQRRQFEDRLTSTEPIATFSLTNSLAGFLSPWLLVAVAMGASLWRAAGDRRRALLAAAFSTALIGGCWVLTKSRTAWLATLLGFALLAVYGRRGGWRPDWRLVAAPLSAAVLLLLFGMVVGGLDLLVVTESAKALQYRFEYWQSSAAMIADYPWWGCGPGNFQQYYTAYKLPQASETVADPHNLLFEIWATAGTPALLALLAVLAAFAWQVRRAVAAAEAADEPANEDGKLPASGRARRTSAVDHDGGAIWPVYAGAAVGVLIAFFPCGFLVGYMPDRAGVLLAAVPAGALALFLWHPWVRAGRLSLPALLSAIVLLLVNLLAAGGIGFAGVSLTLWLLMALTLNHVRSPREGRALSRPAAIAVVVLLLAVVFLCHRTSYAPLLRSAGFIAAGRTAQERWAYDEAEYAFARAAAADPYAYQPWLQLTLLRYQRWRDERTQPAFAAFRAAADEVLRLNPRSSKAQTEYGHWLLAAFRLDGNAEHLQAAIAHYRAAVELYPHDNLGHAQLAWAYHLAGNSSQAARRAAEALRLDAQNPHREQQLSRRQLYDPGPSRGQQQPPAPQADAEQIMRKLRKPA